MPTTSNKKPFSLAFCTLIITHLQVGGRGLLLLSLQWLCFILCRFLSFTNSLKFSAIIYWNILFPSFSLFFLSATPIRFMWDISFCPPCLLMFLYFYVFIFLGWLPLGDFLRSISQFIHFLSFCDLFIIQSSNSIQIIYDSMCPLSLCIFFPQFKNF